MRCPCGDQEVPDGSKFCGHCGKSIPADWTGGTDSYAQTGGGGPTLVEGSAELQKTLAMTALSPSDTVSEMAETPAADALVPQSQPEVTEPGPAPEVDAPAAATPQPSAQPSVMLDPSLQDHAVVTEAPPTPTEIAPAAKTTEKTAAAPKKQEPAKPAEPAKKAPEPAGGDKGGFRETMWFMDAVDPEALSGIEDQDIRDRAEKFDDDGREIDEETRKKFSLRAGNESPGKTQMAMAAQKLDDIEAEAKSGSGGMIFVVLIVLGGLGAAAWFFLK